MVKRKIVIIGGGVVGSVAAYYLSKTTHDVTLIDDGIGQATKASAGIICPWFSQRRNQDWYHLVDTGATFYRQLVEDLTADGVKTLPFHETGSLVFKRSRLLAEKLLLTAKLKREANPTIGSLNLLSPESVKQIYPNLQAEHYALYASGGGYVDGQLLISTLQNIAEQNGTTIIREKARIASVDRHSVAFGEQVKTFDHIILAVGAWLPELLAPFGLKTDIRPQKGQLITCQTNRQTSNWPVCMLIGETDILPYGETSLIIGATHENDQLFDLTPSSRQQNILLEEAKTVLTDIDLTISGHRVGTRAYTSDFLPLIGPIPSYDHIIAVSGLGSSGLTSGPLIGYEVAQTIANDQPLVDYLTPFSAKRYIK
ncbi:NAD(P)/FAD-dependent oxidoreductase [Bavariicoccus seileri]|uniref:NAD(P)/FAD-dependent oxidoreductase n=1 Tax=Bavariicoccus seileri TaxID=549685 RepID=UPI003F8DA749